MKTAAQALDLPADLAEGCPILRSSRLLGDRWTLIILRDIMFDDRRTFRELHRESSEGIASNILSNRLKRMVTEGLLTQVAAADETGRKPYALTDWAIDLVPVIAGLVLWGLQDTPSPADIRARLFYGGGPRLWLRFQDELRTEHLGTRAGSGKPVRARLAEAERRVLAGLGPIAMAPLRRGPALLTHQPRFLLAANGVPGAIAEPG